MPAPAPGSARPSLCNHHTLWSTHSAAALNKIPTTTTATLSLLWRVQANIDWKLTINQQMWYRGNCLPNTHIHPDLEGKQMIWKCLYTNHWRSVRNEVCDRGYFFSGEGPAAAAAAAAWSTQWRTMSSMCSQACSQPGPSPSASSTSWSWSSGVQIYLDISTN